MAPRKKIIAKDFAGGMIRIGNGTIDLLNDPDSIADWDDEELRRGHRKAKDGSFTGVRPKVIPRVAYEELMRRTIDHCMEEMRSSMPEMIKVLTTIARDEGIPPGDKIKAIDLCMKRVLGKEPLTVNLSASVTPAWQRALDVSVVNSDEDDEVFTDDDDEEFE